MQRRAFGGSRSNAGRRLSVALSSVAALVVIAGCGGGGARQDEQAGGGERRSRGETVKIGLLLDDVHERWQRDRDLIKEVVEDMGGELLVEAAEGDQTRQNALASKLLDGGAKVLIVVAHDTQNAAPLVESAKTKGASVISYDRLIQNAPVDAFLGFDTVKVGELQARYLFERAPKGNYLLIGGAPTDGNAKNLRVGQMNVLGPVVKTGAVKIVGDGWAEDWSAAAAARLTEEGLDKAKNNVIAIVASNDVTAGGAIGVLEKRGLAGKVLVSGQDAELEAARRIVAGTQTMTVYKSLRTITRLAARSAVLMARGQKVDTGTTVNNGQTEVPAMLFDPIAVDRDNLDGILIGDGFLRRADVYGKT